MQYKVFFSWLDLFPWALTFLLLTSLMPLRGKHEMETCYAIVHF